MKKTVFLRKLSHKNLKIPSRAPNDSPYNLHLRKTLAQKARSSEFLYKINQKNLAQTNIEESNLDVVQEKNLKGSHSCINSRESSPQNTFYNNNSEVYDIHIEELIKQLDSKLIEISQNDYKQKFQIHSSIYDHFSKIFPKLSHFFFRLKVGLINNLTRHYKTKINSLQFDIKKKTDMIDSLQLEKVKNITKVNELSSLNIELITRIEKIKENDSEPFVGKRHKEEIIGAHAFIEELKAKSSKIKDLNIQLEELRDNEIKVLQIIEKLKDEGIDFDKIYNSMHVKKNTIGRKFKRIIPQLRVEDLSKSDYKVLLH
ncbi:hypothetical protein SteCoe_36277 [Stentor coeruleus]|uniref:Uncharacterized protein n=1 Tax=Stentor coeruleus TaxID=5963 RepID=A0A1R2AQH6_9CILI|nr:hypothetical protein SteCoe_36277 [Stentor coeruleus]